MIQGPGLGRAAGGLALVWMMVLSLACSDDSGGNDGPTLVNPGAMQPMDGMQPSTTPMMDGTAGMPGVPMDTMDTMMDGMDTMMDDMPPTMPAGPTFEPTFSAIFTEILTTGRVGNCMFGACHGGDPDPDLNGNLRIAAGEKDAAHAAMVGVVSTSTLCSGITLVEPGNAAGSLLMQKFDDAPPCGVKMPIGTPLTPEHIEQITTWINNGALND